MRRAYRAILSLYPAEHRAIFAPEILQTFEQAAIEAHRRGAAASLRFAAAELAGLLTGLGSEWLANWTSGARYLTDCSPSDENAVLPSDPAEVQNRLQLVLRGMEFAIAHHDFHNARLYSDRERVIRDHLERLLNQRERPRALPSS